MSTDRPDKTWGVERLGEFCSHSQKKLAVDVWRFGQALNLAKSKQEHGEWQKWKKQYVPLLTHSSEHRYRNLAEKLTEDLLKGIGLTEAYRLLDLTYSKSKSKEEENLFPDAPVAVAAEDCERDEAPDESDDLEALPQLPCFHDLPPAIGLLEVEPEQKPPQQVTGLLEADTDQADRKSPPVVVSQVDWSHEDRYKHYLMHGRCHLESLQAWADWLMELDEGSRFELWHKHGVGSIVGQIDRTIERLRWLAENLAC